MLRTYPKSELYIDVETINTDINGWEQGFVPGAFVRQQKTDIFIGQRFNGRGIIISVDGDDVTVFWSDPPDRRLFGMTGSARRVNYPLIAQQLVSIQPMTLPSGLIFHMDYMYRSGSITYSVKHSSGSL